MPDKNPTPGLWRDLLPFLILGAVLRLWNFGEMPFTNDELSALYRTDFSDFGSLIRDGVAPDAHPALTQVFLWIWVQLSGPGTWLVRLPFVAAGLASIIVIYRLALRAFNPGTAQIAAALTACSQIFVYFSNVARPYAFGMLICSAMAWYWYRCIFEERPKLGPHVWLAVLLALSVYNHYFSGLLGIIIWLSGLMFAGRIHKAYYFGSGVLAFILFLPHLSVSLTQLGHKGVGGWLRPPAPDFLWEWFMSLINYSTVSALLIAALIAWKTREYWRDKQNEGSRSALLFLTWFVLSYAIGHAYSLAVDPLLHHGALLFAGPFFCLGLAYFIAPRSPILAKAAAYGIAALLTFSLVWQRKHFEVFEQQPYAKVAEQLEALDAEGAPALAVVHQNPAYLAHYVDVNALKNTRVINLAQQPQSNAELMEEIGNPEIQRLYLDGRNWALTRAAEEVWSLDRRSNGFTFTGHHYSSRRENGARAEGIVLSESAGSLTAGDEFLELYKAGLDTAGIGFGDHVAAVLRFGPADSASGPWSESDLHLVFAFSKNDELMHYSSAIPPRDGFTHRGSFRLVHQLLLWDLFINYREMKGVELKVYVWNPTGLSYILEAWEVTLTEGNPYLYGQLNRMP